MDSVANSIISLKIWKKPAVEELMLNATTGGGTNTLESTAGGGLFS